MKLTNRFIIAALALLAIMPAAHAATAKFDNVSATTIHISGTGVVISASKPGATISTSNVYAKAISATTANLPIITGITNLTVGQLNATGISVTTVTATTVTSNQSARAYASSDASGNYLGGYNVATISRASTGLYNVSFTTPMATNNYAITATLSFYASTPGCTNSLYIRNNDTSGFRLQINSTCDTGTFNSNIPWSFVVFEAR